MKSLRSRIKAENFFLVEGCGNSDGGQGASITGVYWGLLGALTSFAYWGAREAEGSGNSDGGQGADLLVSLEALGSLAVRE